MHGSDKPQINSKRRGKTMKKLVAFLLAVMMLMTAAASAETASVFTFLDPVLTID